MEYFKLFKRLFEERVRYLICGGLAVNIYGIPRMTMDIDLLLDFEEENIKSFNKAVEDLSYKPSVPISLQSLLDEEIRRKMIQEKNLIAYSYYNGESNFISLDVLIDTPISFKTMWERKEVRNAYDSKVYIVSLEDLISLKTYANRNQDKQDVILLSRLMQLS
ncbi:MAG: nucleotidyl transferase AbiEii/AbiGii toxin family protein [Flammeovirgaceae bacterium]|nr:nucleotidyl transferase AbiEii/AbiGii toxin family protein [Flammeovirgaceae bacterium]MDW8287872.1 nucleotidyl transferase AbiEii/AbiGii toxin family protein [Flammeovirgaceae bacterium]